MEKEKVKNKCKDQVGVKKKKKLKCRVYEGRSEEKKRNELGKWIDIRRGRGENRKHFEELVKRKNDRKAKGRRERKKIKLKRKKEKMAKTCFWCSFKPICVQ